MINLAEQKSVIFSPPTESHPASNCSLRKWGRNSWSKWSDQSYLYLLNYLSHWPRQTNCLI